ncbi:MAG: FG-GAP-like repeat-containing protein [bacterium]
MKKLLVCALLLIAGAVLLTAPVQGYPDRAGVEHPLSLLQKTTKTPGPTDDYPQMPGFPVYMGVGALFAPTEGPIQVDVDGDGNLEIFAGSTDAYLRGWHHDGTPVAGFPIYTSGPIQGSPAAGDIDGDGDLEILIGNRAGDVYAIHHDGTTVSGWPQHTLDEIAINSVALWDFDGDGDYEVFVGSDRLYVWQGDGTLLPGFPVNFSGAQYGTCSTSSAGDIDGDGDAEIILEGWNYLNAFHHNGTVVAGWPYALSGYFGFSYSAPSLADVDSDGDCEIFCAAHESGGGGWNSNLFGLDGNGTNLPGFPQFIQGWTYSTPSIGDLDDDGELEIALLCNSALLYAFNPNGSSVSGFPVNFGHYNCEAATAMVDIDGNGQLDLLFGNNGGSGGYQYLCYRANGSAHPDFPFSTDYATFPTCSAIADADGDGDLEIAHHVGSGTVYLWDVPYAAAAAQRPWPMPHHDAQHSGNYHHVSAPISDVSVVLTPYGTPIIIPATGGTLEFEIAITNNENTTVNFQAWTTATLPNGRVYGPLLGPVPLTLSGGASLVRERSQYVPLTAPEGSYLYNAFVGVYPGSIWDSDSFPFVKVGDGEGSFDLTDWFGGGEPLEAEAQRTIPQSISSSCHPNPLNPSATLRFALPAAASVRLTVYDISGREIAVLVDDWCDAGDHQAVFDGSKLTSGIYFYRIQTEPQSSFGKMLLIK